MTFAGEPNAFGDDVPERGGVCSRDAADGTAVAMVARLPMRAVNNVGKGRKRSGQAQSCFLTLNLRC